MGMGSTAAAREAPGKKRQSVIGAFFSKFKGGGGGGGVSVSRQSIKKGPPKKPPRSPTVKKGKGVKNVAPPPSKVTVEDLNAVGETATLAHFSKPRGPNNRRRPKGVRAATGPEKPSPSASAAVTTTKTSQPADGADGSVPVSGSSINIRCVSTHKPETLSLLLVDEYTE